MANPRVMTAAEVFEAEGFIWLEVKDEGLWHLRVFCSSAPGLMMFDVPGDTYECKLNQYGEKWRCWTEQPTRAEMAWTRWDQSAFWK